MPLIDNVLLVDVAVFCGLVHSVNQTETMMISQASILVLEVMTTGLEDGDIFQIIVLNHPVAGNKTSFYDEMKKK